MERILQLRLLELFVAVAEHRSFSVAADELLLSQSAVSRGLQELERRLGCVLVDRGARPHALTAEGEELLRAARRVLDAHDSALRSFGLWREGQRGLLTVATIPSVAATVLPPLVRAFREHHPQVEVRLADGLAGGVLQEVHRGAADLAITAVPTPVSADGLQAVPLLRDALYAVMREDHPLAARERVPWSALTDEPFISLSSDSSVRPLTDRAFRACGQEPPGGYQATNVATVGGLVAAGLGLSALPALVLGMLSPSGIAARPLDEPEVQRTIAVVTDPARPATPVAELFLRLLSRPPGPPPHGAVWL